MSATGRGRSGTGRATTALLLAALLLLGQGPVGAAQEGGPGQAGLVVQFEDGHTETQCVAFEGETINGADLLARSGLDVVLDATGGMGVTVCQIEGQGCAYPAEPCFCQCMGGGDCRYWNYFYRDPGAPDWTYSPLGVQLRQVQSGALEAWVWGDATPPAAGITFDAVCAAPTVVPTPAAATPIPTAAPTRPAPTPTPTLPVATQAAVAPVVSPSPGLPAGWSAPLSSPPQGTGAYWLFGAMALVLAVAGAFLWLRRGGR